jgi:hypothetical protein
MGDVTNVRVQVTLVAVVDGAEQESVCVWAAAGSEPTRSGAPSATALASARLGASRRAENDGRLPAQLTVCNMGVPSPVCP